MLTLYPSTLLNLLILVPFYLFFFLLRVDSLRFSVKMIMSVNKDGFSFSFISSSYLIALVRISSTVN